MSEPNAFSSFIDWLESFKVDHPPGSFHISVDLQEPKPPDEITDLSAYLTLGDTWPRVVLVQSQLDLLQRMRLNTAVTPFKKKLGWGWNDFDAIQHIIFHYFFLYEYDRFCINDKSIFSYFPWFHVPRFPLFSLSDVLDIWDYYGGYCLEAMPSKPPEDSTVNLSVNLSSTEASKLIEVLQYYKSSEDAFHGDGVSMLDAALILNDGDKTIARETVDRWQRQKSVKQPTHIGNDPKHKQIKLYEPNLLIGFLKKIEGENRYDYRKLIQGLISLARNPRSN
jgi:hypothetical protein